MSVSKLSNQITYSVWDRFIQTHPHMGTHIRTNSPPPPLSRSPPRTPTHGNKIERVRTNRIYFRSFSFFPCCSPRPVHLLNMPMSLHSPWIEVSFVFCSGGADCWCGGEALRAHTYIISIEPEIIIIRLTADRCSSAVTHLNCVSGTPASTRHLPVRWPSQPVKVNDCRLLNIILRNRNR